MKNLTFVVFSKDRPMQCEALLDSLRYFVTTDDVYYKVVLISKETEETKTYYRKYCYGLVDDQLDDNGTKPFKQLVQEATKTSDYVSFLVDDIIWKGFVDLLEDEELKNFEQEKESLCFSFRLGTNIVGSFVEGRAYDRSEIPYINELGRFNWKQGGGDWGYPMSLDGNVFRQTTIGPLIDKLEFNNPNQLEAQLAMWATRNKHTLPDYCYCYNSQSKLLNIPCNRVQDEFPNKTLNKQSADDLLELMKQDKMIDWKQYSGTRNTSPHWTVPYKFINRK